jgi:signal recognition particle receptor subunit beta
MAVIDSEAGEIVIRLVYDGPPEAGKTTSLRALAGSLAQPSYTPAEDANGRTLWFDWMEYVGGRFEGSRIRCQVVSVPGQRELGARRRRVLEDADVIVFVGDSSAREVPRTLAHLFELRALIADAADAPIGVILQANKRDLEDAIPLDELRARLAERNWPIGVVESVAADGTGIREAFVYAVRLALDRTRELMIRGALRTAGVRTSADELLASLRAEEQALATQLVDPPPAVVEVGPQSPAAALLREVLEFETSARTPAPPRGNRNGPPRLPDAAVPSGAIWPPVEGRAILSELAQTTLVVRRLSNGDWAAGLGSGWRVMSTRDAAFATLDQGRAALIQWARVHASANGVISPRRCVVLADDGDGGWRLWQVVRTEESLRELISRELHDYTGEALIARMCQAVQLLVDAQDQLGHLPLVLPCNLDTIGSSEIGAIYIGLMPDPSLPLAEARPRGDSRVLLRSQLDAAIGADLRERGLDLDSVLARVPARTPRTDNLARPVTTLLGA